MWKRFLKAMEYRSYCMAIRTLRQQGLYEEARRVADYKNSVYAQ